MAVTLGGVTQAVVTNDEAGTVAIPPGTAAGTLAIVEVSHSDDGIMPSGWVSANPSVWWKLLSANDIAAGSVAVQARLHGMATYPGGAGVNRTSSQSGVKTVPGGGVYTRGWTDRGGSALGPTTNRLGASVEFPDPDDRHWHSSWFTPSPAGGYVSVPVERGIDCQSYEIVPFSAPPAPTVARPVAGGYASAAGPITVAWVPSPTHEGATPSGYRLSVRAVGAPAWSYVSATGTVVAMEQSVTSSVTMTDIAAGQLPPGAYELRAATAEGPLWSPYSASVVFTVANPPTVTGLSVSSPLNDLTPTVSWVPATTVGTQTAYSVTLLREGIALFSTGMRAGAATSWTFSPRADWVNSGAYETEVLVQQTGGLQSAPARVAFSPTWTPPAAPTSIAPVDTRPMQVLVTGLGSNGVQIEFRRTPDGEWLPVLDEPAPTPSYVAAFPLAPYGIAVQFRARSYAVVDRVQVFSAWVTSSPATSSDTSAYFVADDGHAYLPVTLKTEGTRDVIQGTAVSWAFGNPHAQIDEGPVLGERGSLDILTATEAERVAVTDWIATQGVWWLRFHPEGKTVAAEPVHQESIRMGRAEGVRYDRAHQVRSSKRVITLDWVSQGDKD